MNAWNKRIKLDKDQQSLHRRFNMYEDRFNLDKVYVKVYSPDAYTVSNDVVDYKPNEKIKRFRKSI